MANGHNLPSYLELGDVSITSLTIQDVERLFNIASELNVADEFVDNFWSKAARDVARASLQGCLNNLERYKRQIGRVYDKACKKYGKESWLAAYQRVRYNELEYEIRFLVERYGCTRKTKAYLLEV